jgi:hypothetical protein
VSASERESKRQSSLVLHKLPLFVSQLKNNSNNTLSTVLEYVETHSNRGQAVVVRATLFPLPEKSGQTLPRLQKRGSRDTYVERFRRVNAL